MNVSKQHILVTGAAGFIGMHVCAALLEQGYRVLGIDNLNDYYDPALKQARLATLSAYDAFRFEKIDIADRDAMAVLGNAEQFDAIIHLAAQAGVRYSIDHPHVYADANLVGQLNMLELARGQMQKTLQHFVYASSSSVYGANTKVPFAVEDSVDHPVSLYAATKRAGELMADSYARLYAIPMTGLRFFTVYGPWGRPDMALWKFTDAIVAGRPIDVYNHGKMKRDFTYIDDIVSGVLGVLGAPPAQDKMPRHAVYNLGNHRSETLMDFIAEIEKAVGKKAVLHHMDMQPGDVPETYADIAASTRDFGFIPTTPISDGIPKFVAWFKQYQQKRAI